MSHTPLPGYRELTPQELERAARVKNLASSVGDVIDYMRRDPDGEGFDQRAVSIAATELQTGFMWLVRAVTQPTTF